MTGEFFAETIERELSSRKISKGTFYEACGISATAMYGWKRGAEPKRETIKVVEDYLGIDFSAYTSDKLDSETADLLQGIRDRQDLRILMRSAQDLPASSVYELIAKIERMKEDAN